VGVHFPAEHALELELAHTGLKSRGVALDVLGCGLVVFELCEIEQLGGIGDGGLCAVELLELGAQARALFSELLGALGCAPDSRVLQLAVDFL
jgi:hypothetical protein